MFLKTFRTGVGSSFFGVFLLGGGGSVPYCMPSNKIIELNNGLISFSPRKKERKKKRRSCERKQRKKKTSAKLNTHEMFKIE